ERQSAHVVLPAARAPTRARICPSSAVNDTASSARRPPKRLVSPTTSRMRIRRRSRPACVVRQSGSSRRYPFAIMGAREAEPLVQPHGGLHEIGGVQCQRGRGGGSRPVNALVHEGGADAT